MTPIEQLIEVAKQEIGYLEKENNKYLEDKKINAGDENFTKYWSELYPKFQGQPWCAIFVTWCFVKAFGAETTKKLLKHFPFTYCPTLGYLFQLNANPKVGDIVLFYRNNEFVHTGIVTTVNGDYFTTIEGNTSNKNEIVPNGGSVCSKGYYNSSLPGTKFVTVDWSLVDNFEEDIKLTGKIIASSLNIRKFPNISSEIIGKHSFGDEVNICAKANNNWYKVNYPNIGIGYIFGDYVIISDEKEDSIDQEEFNQLLGNYLKKISKEKPNDWSVDARKYCEKNKIINGDENGCKNYRAYLTREELVSILYNIFGEKVI